MSFSFDYEATLVLVDGEPADVRVVRQGRTSHVGGRRGRENELARVSEISHDVLPVFLGAGLGWGVDACLAAGRPVVVVDVEAPLLAQTGLRERWRNHPLVYWIDAPDPEVAIALLTHRQLEHDGLPPAPILHPFYARLRPEMYRVLDERLRLIQEFDFWSRARYPKFSSSLPRILLLTSKYFLMGELEAACVRLGYPVSFVQLPSQEVGTQEFVERILAEILRFRPDFVLTINHLGVDKEGVLTDLLARLELPLASWFVDNPHLILYIYENLSSDWVTLFTWDADNLESLRERGFERVYYLPLATDPHRFSLRPSVFVRDTAFVGNSMVSKVRAKLEQYAFPAGLTVDLELLGRAFMETGELSVAEFLRRNFTEHFDLFIALPDVDSRLAFETLITWQATLIYRLRQVRRLLPFYPLLAGDRGWFELLPQSGWEYRPELNYYADLPVFYPTNRINFNCTSQQMKGAVNQRVFDVPACGGFLLTDHRRQLEDLFDPEREMICYHDEEEIADLVRYYLPRDAERARIAQAGRARVLAEHTYDLRLASLVDTMRRIYG